MDVKHNFPGLAILTTAPGFWQRRYCDPNRQIRVAGFLTSERSDIHLDSKRLCGYAGHMNHLHNGWFLAVTSLWLTACIASAAPTASTETPSPSAIVVTETPSPLPPSPTFTPSVIPSATSTLEPIGCLKPPDDYTRLDVNGETLNARTLAMLTQAQRLYGGEIELTGYAITQGSYTEGESASFGTHAGGGAADLSVLRQGTYEVLWDDIEPLIHSLRAAGFAAWLREYGELYTDSPIHIHAIAIGDAELSPAAQEQLTGESGYFRGYSGLPVEMYGPPTADRYGGPTLCRWMIDLGYEDLR